MIFLVFPLLFLTYLAFGVLSYLTGRQEGFASGWDAAINAIKNRRGEQ